MDNNSVFKLYPVRTAPFFALGILFAANGGVTAVIMMILSALLCIALSFSARKLLASAIALCLGMVSISCYNHFVREPVLAASGTTQTLTCTVTNIRNLGGYSLYSCNTTVNGASTVISFFEEAEFMIGDEITADIALKKLQRTYEAERQYLSGTVKEIHSCVHPEFCLERSLHEYRTELCEDIAANVSGDGKELVKGLIFGDTSGFSSELRQSARISGVMHFTAVSGMHFVIIMTVLLELSGTKRPKLRALTAIAYIPLAVMFFGAEPTVLRAGIMLILHYCGGLFNRKAESLNSLCVAVLAMTVFTPYVMLSAGFQMSVLGVFGVSVVGSRCNRFISLYTRKLTVFIRKIIESVVTSACAVICIAPVSIYCFGGVSLIGVFATVLLAPLFTLILTFAVFFAVTGIDAVLIPVSLLMNAAYQLIMTLGSCSAFWLAMESRFAPMLAGACAVGLSLAMLIPKKLLDKGLIAAGAAIAASLVLCIVSALTRYKVDFVSDGTSGAAVICEQSTATILICGGGAELSDGLSDCLMRNGITHIELIAASELQPAGAGLVSALYRLYPIDAVSTNENAAEYILQSCPDSAVTTQLIKEISVNDITLACAKAGDTECTADIVLYSGYKMSEPQYGAGLPLYVSSRQNILPENGINIYDTEFEISLEN